MAIGKGTRSKRTPEEQALWDSIEEMKEERRLTLARFKENLDTLKTLENEGDATLAAAARKLIEYELVAVSLAEGIAEAEERYKKMRAGNV